VSFLFSEEDAYSKKLPFTWGRLLSIDAYLAGDANNSIIHGVYDSFIIFFLTTVDSS